MKEKEDRWLCSIDRAINERKAYHDGNPQTCSVHIFNFRKIDLNDWMNVIEAEAGTLIPEQLNKVQLFREAAGWLGKRNDAMIILMRGKDVP